MNGGVAGGEYGFKGIEEFDGIEMGAEELESNWWPIRFAKSIFKV